MSDSTPLLSTLVQAGATLVAIIAGLLIARLVALAGERNALERRVKELAEVLDERKSDLSSASQALLDEDGDTFIYFLIDDYFDKSKSFDDLYSYYLNRQPDEARSQEELQPYFDRFVALVDDVTARLGLDALVTRPRDWDDASRARLVEQFRDGYEKNVAEKLLDKVEDYWRSQQPAHFSQVHSLVSSIGKVDFLTPATLRAATATIESARYRDLVRREAAAEAALRDTELELGHARLALAATSRPEGLWVTVLLLVGIAVAGVVLPLLQMSLGPTVLSTVTRVIYVGLFLVSLVAFFVYLGVELRRITRPLSGK